MFLFSAISLHTAPLALQSVMRTTDKNAHLDGSPTEDSVNLFIKRPRIMIAIAAVRIHPNGN